MGRRPKPKVLFKNSDHMQKCILSVLKDLRKNRGLTQAELSHLLGRNSDIVSKIECELFRPSLKVIRDYGIAFNLSLSDILKLAEDKAIDV